MSVPVKKKQSLPIQNIKVVVRVRPIANNETKKIVVHCVSPEEIHAKVRKYQFDKIFPPDSTQMDLYLYVVSPMISDVIAGYNCTVFAYGQTGTGKTHTMIGGDPSLSVYDKDDELAGCIPRAAAHIFDEIGLLDIVEYNVRISFLELYNEEVWDLLNEDNSAPPLNMFNDSKGSINIQGLKEITVSNSNEIYSLLRQGTNKRRTAPTLSNNHSSRSHTVFTITVHTRESTITGEEILKTGKINLVDLAGSENLTKSGLKEQRAVESANINKSLLTLGRVIHILAERKSKHVPYRDSKLTRILQDSLGGHTKTCIIATVSPLANAYDETTSTLEYACRARDIKNTPLVNEKVTKAQLMKEMAEEVDKLKRDLDAARSGEGFYIDKANWERMNSERQNMVDFIDLKTKVIENLKKKISDLEEIREMRVKEFDRAMKECGKREAVIDKATRLLKKNSLSLKQEEYVSSYYEEIASKATTNAKKLLESTRQLSGNQAVLRQKLETQYANNSKNEQTVKEKTNQLLINLNVVKQEEGSLSSNSDRCSGIVNELLSLQKTTDKSRKDETQSLKPFFEKQHNRAEKLVKQSRTVVHLAEDVFEGARGKVVTGKDTASRLSERLDEYEKESSKRSQSTSQLLESIKLFSLREKERSNVLKDLKTYGSIVRKSTEHMSSLLNTFHDTIAEHNSSANTILTRNTSELNKSVAELVRGNAKLDADIDEVIAEMESFKSITELEQESLPMMQALGNQIVKNSDDFQHLLGSYNDAVASQMTSISTRYEAQQKVIQNHVQKVGNCLRNCDDLVRVDIQKNIIPVERSGDTPKKCTLNYPKRMNDGMPPREAVIEKFKEEVDKDVEKLSLSLDSSADSSGNLQLI